MKYRKLKNLFFVLLVCMGLTACGGEEAVEHDWNDDSYREDDSSWGDNSYSDFYDDSTGDVENDTETDVPEATEGSDVQEDVERSFLKAKSRDLLSLEEVHIFGCNPLTLRINDAKNLLEKNGMQVSFEVTPEGTLQYEGELSPKGTSLHVWGSDYQECISFWSFMYFPKRQGKRLEVGARDICMYDTFGDVLNKMGFQNGFEAERELKSLVGETSILDLSESERTSIEKVFNFSMEGGVSVQLLCGLMADEFFLWIVDESFTEYYGLANFYLKLRFVRSKETEGEYALMEFAGDILEY